jgi:hypothetical protein
LQPSVRLGRRSALNVAQIGEKEDHQMSNVRTQNELGMQATGQSNGMAVAGLICGILGVIFGGYLLAPLAIIFGGVALKRANRGAGRRGMAKADIGLGIVGIVSTIVFVSLRIYYLG